MTDITPNTPVLVGIGIVDQKIEDWTKAKEAIELMTDAAHAAVDDTGVATIASAVERIYVPRGLWNYTDPARLVGQAIGSAEATTVWVEIGVLQQTAIGDACRRIAEGELDVAMVVGGEAKYRSLRAHIAGQEATETTQSATPDISMQPAAELYQDAEVNSGLGHMPVNYYAIMESAFRAAKGWSIAQHRDRLAAMYSRFSDIATENPHAWKPGHVAADTIRNPSAKNRMLAFPYTKLHNTSWNVDQASALLFCSAGKAESLGVARQHWIFPLASTECGHMLSVAQRKELHRSPGAHAAGQKALEIAACSAEELDFLELYSCFPVAVESFAAELGLDLDFDRDLTVTGGMPFAGGPLNNYVLQATCRMVELLRQQPGSKGLVTSVSGLLTKQGFGVWSTEPGEQGFQFVDVTEELAAANPSVEVVEDAAGEALIVGYTVLYHGDDRSRAVAMVDLADGRRGVVWSEDAQLMARMEEEEFCGCRVSIGDSQFTPL